MSPANSGSAHTARKEPHTGDGQHKAQLPTGFRPGRLSPLEILERVFPLQRKSVLELVLQGCNGDLVKAIEHFLSAQDTMAAQSQAGGRQADVRHSNPFLSALSGISTSLGMTSSSGDVINSHLPSVAAMSRQSGLRPPPLHATPPSAHGPAHLPSPKLPYGPIKSAFTPLSAGNPGIHSAFSGALPHFPGNVTASAAEAALRNPFLGQGHLPSELLSHNYPHAYAGLGMGFGMGSLPGSSYPGMLANPFSFHPYRLNLRGGSPPRIRTPDKNSEKSALTDSDHISDSWDEGGSPRDLKAGE